jgi:GTP-binding protein YchF
MRVALIGPPQSGKSTMFAAVATAGGSHVDLSRPDQAHLAVVKVPDERLDWLAELHHPEKYTPAELEFLDLPGFDLADEAGRTRARTHWQEMEQSDMLAFVVAGFSSSAVPAYRGRVDPVKDLEELKDEMLFADLERVGNRIHKLDAALKKPTQHRDEQQREMDLMQRLQQTLESEKPIAEAIQTESESKFVRSFQFLTLKPTLAVVNCGEAEAGQEGPAELAGLPCMRLSAKIEAELSQLPPEDRAVFLSDLGLAAPARDRLIRACYRRLNLLSFLTDGPDECRAWTVPVGTDAVTAAGEIHSDIARGFIRAEVVAFEDLKAHNDHKGAKAAGKVRQEGKGYLIKDGDVVFFKFNV